VWLRYRARTEGEEAGRDAVADLVRLFHRLLLVASGDVEQALAWLRQLAEQHGLWPDGMDLAAFRDLLLREGEIAEGRPGGPLALTRKGERGIRRDSLDRSFSQLAHGGPGDHATARAGVGGEVLSETRPFGPGDDLALVDWNRSFRNAALRSPGEGLVLAKDDLEVRETEQRTTCATVVLLDISHSMILYGEDRITPAKQVAIGLAQLITTRYPKDRLEVVLFGDDAQRVPVARLPYVEVGPYHTNTRAGLRMARGLLERSKAENRQVFMITDGKPSALTEEGGRIYKNPMGLDRRIVNKTLEEATTLRRKGITVTTFMIASDPDLVQFVDSFTRLNKGRAYYSSPDRLGSYLFVDYIRNRRRWVH
jgi:uncharacterized protein with von Willebrand factor type A (vWA) domain